MYGAVIIDGLGDDEGAPACSIELLITGLVYSEPGLGRNDFPADKRTSQESK